MTTRSKMRISIQADCNDADYISNTEQITIDELVLIMPIINRLNLKKKEYLDSKDWNQRRNWDTSEYSRNSKGPAAMYSDLKDTEGFVLFSELVPYGQHGVHTIVSVEIIKESETLFEIT